MIEEFVTDTGKRCRFVTDAGTPIVEMTATVARARRAKARAQGDVAQHRRYLAILTAAIVLSIPAMVGGAVLAGLGLDTGAMAVHYLGNALMGTSGPVGGVAVIVALVYATECYRTPPSVALRRATDDFDAAMRGEDPFDTPECERRHYGAGPDY